MIKSSSYKYDFVIKGAYGTGNFGDDALFDVVFNQLPPNSKVAVIARNASYLKDGYPMLDVYHPNDVASINCSVFIYGGGTQFYLFPTSDSFIFKVKYHLKNPKNLINKILRRGLEISYDKKIGLGLGLGPFYTKNSSKFKKIINDLKSFDELYVRDTKSYDFCKNNKVKNVKINTDLCFLKKLTKLNSSEKSAVILRDWIHDEGGRKHFPAIKEYLIKNKNNTDLVLFANDSEWVNFAKLNNINLVKWEPKVYSSKSFIEKLSQYKFFISSRFHGVVYGTLLGIPAISIEIEPKLMIGASLNTGLIWNDDFNINQLYSLIEELNNDYENHVKNLNVIREKKYMEASDMSKALLNINAEVIE
ncbi:Polysaccharide pyruvyl transferase [Pseudoalteromonas sp. P1-30]|uniref:polysaccharide pyruvyl transferase family protein n=1 Tax=Pseudoalteromonas sp. P1-30 TaxID=1723760 RepID=UPI0006D611FC|nr:polysaccharide pyruvyl transferase family protein [Pseudoalteromonas sp. P1-30]KPV91527.1 Polysaccharide pyruvyl transferase [Pseudoalteromonas sp. P1-30]